MSPKGQGDARRGAGLRVCDRRQTRWRVWGELLDPVVRARSRAHIGSLRVSPWARSVPDPAAGRASNGRCVASIEASGRA